MSIGDRVHRLLETRRRERQVYKKLLDSGIFEPDFYVNGYPDVARARFDPALHFIRHGAREGRSPSSKFSIFHYVKAHPISGLDDVDSLIDRLLKDSVSAPSAKKQIDIHASPAHVAPTPARAEGALIDALDDAYVIPYRIVRGIFHGGVDADTPNVRMTFGDTFRDHPPQNVDRAGAEFVRGRYLYGGPLWNHFGHVLVDCLHRLWAHDDHDGIVFTGVVGLAGVTKGEQLLKWETPAYVLELIELMGIAPKQLIFVNRPMIFERLDAPRPGAAWGCGVEPFYLPHLQRYQQSIEARTRGIETPKRIYFSRRHLTQNGAAIILGCSYFESELAKSGYEIVQPEKQSLLQQFANILNAESIVFDEGSTLHPTELLARVPAPMYMFPRRPGDFVFSRSLPPRGTFHTLAEDAQIRLLPDRNGKVPSPLAITYYAEPEKVFQKLVDHGLVGGAFDKKRYVEAEMADLLECKSRDMRIRQSRFRTMNDVRGGGPTPEPFKKGNSMALSRAQVVQKLLALFENPNYLEVGVNSGTTFAAVKAERKVAVDPKFLFDTKEWGERFPNAEFHEITSDAFFETNTELFNVIYLDGLHTFEQTLRDFTNAIMCLKEGGIILLDDTVPSSYHASMPDLAAHLKMRKLRNDPSGAWMGDVYRLVFFIETFFQQFSYATLQDNHGQTVVWRKVRAAGSFPERSVASVAALPYEQVYLNHEVYRVMDMNDIIREIQASRE